MAERKFRGGRDLGLLALLCAVTIWGGSFVVTKDGLDGLSSFHLLALRFFVALVVLAPFALRRTEFRETASRPGAWLLGLTLFAGLSLQTEGLVSTSPGRSAFLTSLSVVFVPFLCWLVFARKPRPIEWIAVGMCALGLMFLYPGLGTDATVGDGYSLLCAVAFATYVLLGERVSRTMDLISAMAIQCLCCFLLSALVLPFATDGSLLPGTGAELWAVLYVGLLATAAAFGLQLFAQRRLGAVETAVLLALEPAVAAVISVSLGFDSLTTGLVIGGVLLVAGALAVQRDEVSSLSGRGSVSKAPEERRA